MAKKFCHFDFGTESADEERWKVDNSLYFSLFTGKRRAEPGCRREEVLIRAHRWVALIWVREVRLFAKVLF